MLAIAAALVAVAACTSAGGDASDAEGAAGQETTSTIEASSPVTSKGEVIKPPPPTIDSGEIETSAGTIRWSRLQGDISNVPGGWSVTPLTTSFGFALFERSPANQLFDEGGARLWISEDLGSWSRVPLPVEATGGELAIGVADGALWLIAQSPPQVWTSADGVEWTGFDAPQIEDRPAGFDHVWTTLGAPVALNDRVFFTVTHTLAFPAFDLGINSRVCTERPVRVDEGLYQMTGDEECPMGGPVLRFEETETGLLVVDEESGKELGEIEDGTLDHMESMAQTDELLLTSFFTIEGDSLEPVELAPGSEQVQRAVPWAPLLSTGDSLLAFSDGTLWKTTNGSEWTDIETPLVEGWVTTLSDRFVWNRIGGQFITEVAESTDGVEWTPAPVSPPPQTSLVRLETGWFATPGSIGNIYGSSWWMLAGDEWVPLVDLGMSRWCDVVPTAMGDVTVFIGSAIGTDRNCGWPDADRDLWLVTFDGDS